MLNGMVHQANCFHTMGGGIAKQIKERYPSSYEADLKTPYGDIKKLGTFSSLPDDALSWGEFRIYNCYSQYTFGGKVDTNYEAVEQCFNAIKEHILNIDIQRVSSPDMQETGFVYKLGIPYGYGCGLAGGDWNIVESIIYRVFGECEFIEAQICKLPQ